MDRDELSKRIDLILPHDDVDDVDDDVEEDENDRVILSGMVLGWAILLFDLYKILCVDLVRMRKEKRNWWSLVLCKRCWVYSLPILNREDSEKRIFRFVKKKSSSVESEAILDSCHLNYRMKNILGFEAFWVKPKRPKKYRIILPLIRQNCQWVLRQCSISFHVLIHHVIWSL